MSSTRVPEVGLFRNAQHQYFWNGAGPYPGVTTVIRALDKPGLIEWAKRETARCAVDNYDFVADLIQRGGPKAAAAWLAGIPDFQRDTAGDLGSAVHRLVEQDSRAKAAGFGGIGTDSATPEQQPYVNAYRAFLEDYSPDFVSLERMVFSEKAGYGGTFDWIARIGGKVVLGDTKTSKDVYPETALQLAGLANADFCGLPEDPKKYRIPAIDEAAVLHIRPEKYARGYRLIRYRVGPEEYKAFRACLALTNWKKEPTPVGESYPLPSQEKAA